MIGSGLAVISDGISPSSDRWKADSLSVLGLLLILYSIVAFNDKTTRYPGVIALIPTVGTMLVLRFGNRTTAVGRGLARSASPG